MLRARAMAAELTRTHFHPYDPRLPRLLLAVGAAACLALVVWAARNALAGVERLAWVRAGVAALMLAGFVATLLRLRPRAGWGVLLTSFGLVLSPPLRGPAAELLWREVRKAERTGRRRDRLVLVLKEGQVVLPRLLFPTREAFESLAREVEEHLPRSPFDA